MSIQLYIAAGESIVHVLKDKDHWSLESYDVGHRFLCLAADEKHQGRFYAGTFNDGLWKSDDFGRTWSEVGQGITHSRIPSVAVSSTEMHGNYSVVWAGTEPSGLFRSEDGGETWTDAPSLLDIPSEPTWSFPPRPYTHHARYIQPDLHEKKRVFVGIELGGVMRSLDQGKTWDDRKEESQHDCHSLFMHKDAPGRVYEAAGGGYAETKDGGETWQTINDGLDPYTYLVNIAVDSGDPDTIIASGAKNARTAYRANTAETVIMRRTKNEPWEIVSEGLPDKQGSIVYQLLAHPEKPQTFYAVNNLGLYESTDAGKTWTALPVEWPDRFKEERIRGFISLPG